MHTSSEELRARVLGLAAAVGTGELVASDGAVGGGGAPELALPGWALALPEACAQLLRAADPPVMARVNAGRCLVDPRAVPAARDDELAGAIRFALAALT
jgi:L-seryl-tRNA(Ser) seleniumtransferase